MADDTLSADAMLALANDYDAGVDIDSQPKESSPNTNETAPVEQDSSDAGNASKEVDGGEREVGTKSEPEAKAEKKTEPKDKSSKFAQEQNRKAKTWEQINAEKEALKAEREAVRRTTRLRPRSSMPMAILSWPRQREPRLMESEKLLRSDSRRRSRRSSQRHGLIRMHGCPRRRLG